MLFEYRFQPQNSCSPISFYVRDWKELADNIQRAYRRLTINEPLDEKDLKAIESVQINYFNERTTNGRHLYCPSAELMVRVDAGNIGQLAKDAEKIDLDKAICRLSQSLYLTNDLAALMKERHWMDYKEELIQAFERDQEFESKQDALKEASDFRKKYGSDRSGNSSNSGSGGSNSNMHPMFGLGDHGD